MLELGGEKIRRKNEDNFYVLLSRLDSSIFQFIFGSFFSVHFQVNENPFRTNGLVELNLFGCFITP